MGISKPQMQAILDAADHYRTRSTGRVAQVFNGVHLGKGHQGLSKLAAENGINVDELEMGNFIVFINTKKNAMKVFASGNIVAYMKLPESMVIDMKTIALLPKFFNGGQIRYEAALRERLMKEFPQAQVQVQ